MEAMKTKSAKNLTPLPSRRSTSRNAAMTRIAQAYDSTLATYVLPLDDSIYAAIRCHLKTHEIRDIVIGTVEAHEVQVGLREVNHFDVEDLTVMATQWHCGSEVVRALVDYYRKLLNTEYRAELEGVAADIRNRLAGAIRNVVD